MVKAWLAQIPTVLFRLGGPGLLVLGVLDSSFIPIPGSQDIFTILFSVGDPGLWPYYAVMSTIGSVIGGYLTFKVGMEGGKKALEVHQITVLVKAARKMFRKWGFGAVFVLAVAPPPAPLVPFVLYAGAMNYPTKRFLAAFSAGRGVRFALVAYLASLFGARVLRFMTSIETWDFVRAGIVLAILVGITVIAYYYHARHHRRG